MTVYLSSPFGKLARAMEHMHRLGDLQREYRAQESVEYDIFDNIPDVSSPTISIQWRVRKVAPMDPAWSYVTGDAINNMRAALDHAMLLLAESEAGSFTEQQQRNVFFPIHTDETKWRKWRARNDLGLTDNVLDELEALQPFASEHPADTALALLQRLSNLDKHRRIITHSMVRPDIEPSFDPSLEVVQQKISSEALRDGLTLATVKFKRPRHGGVVENAINVSFFEVLELEDGRKIPIAVALFSMFQAAFHTVAGLLEPFANDLDRWWVANVLDHEEENLANVMQTFTSDTRAQPRRSDSNSAGPIE